MKVIIFWTRLRMLSFCVCCIRVNIAIATQFVVETWKADALRYFVLKKLTILYTEKIEILFGGLSQMYI